MKDGNGRDDAHVCHEVAAFQQALQWFEANHEIAGHAACAKPLAATPVATKPADFFKKLRRFPSKLILDDSLHRKPLGNRRLVLRSEGWNSQAKGVKISDLRTRPRRKAGSRTTSRGLLMAEGIHPPRWFRQAPADDPPGWKPQAASGMFRIIESCGRRTIFFSGQRKLGQTHDRTPLFG